MTSFREVYAALRRKNFKNYLLLIGCCFFSVLLITAYVCMMRSPTVLSVLPEGGDSRKQVMMIFMLAVIGCAVFTTYASGLFFRSKSRETGIFFALGASKRQVCRQIYYDLALISIVSCAAGAILGVPFAWIVWRLFRLLVVDSEEMVLSFDPQAMLFAVIFSGFVILMLFVMGTRFVRRTNIIDIVNESRKSEPIHNVPHWYGKVGIVLMVAGGFLGYSAPAFCVRILHWYAPEGLTGIAYAPVFIGLYMVLLHTVVNGWGRGKNRYRHIISTSMMKFQGRQTVRNMLVITLLIAGSYFGAFYTPMLGTGALMDFEQRTVDYAYRFRNDQDIPKEDEVRSMAEKAQVVITDLTSQPMARLAVDGMESIETTTSFGTTWESEYRETMQSDLFLPESAWNALTGDTLNLSAGEIAAIFDQYGNANGRMGNDVTLVTNYVTGERLPVTSRDEVLKNDVLFGYRVMDDSDYQKITTGLPAEWLETMVFFNVENCADTYPFAKQLFYEIVDRSGPEVEVFDAWDPVRRDIDIQEKGYYFYDPQQFEGLDGTSIERIDYDEPDSTNFRMYWQYMPKFRVLDRADFVKTTAVFLMLFIFISIVCMTAVIVIAYTRCMTIALINRQVYDDLRHLGASRAYLRHSVRGQVKRVFFVPIAVGTAGILGLYLMILYFNGSPHGYTPNEIAGIAVCLVLIAVCSLMLYCIYRKTLKSVWRTLRI